MREQHGDRVLDPANLPAVSAISTFDIQDSRLAAAATVANATGDNGACRGHGRPACCAERGASGAVRGRLCYLLAVLLLAVPPAGATERLRLGYVAGPDQATVGLVLRRWAQGFAFRPESGLKVELAARPAEAIELASRLANGSLDLAWLPLGDLVTEPHPLQLLELPLRGQPAEVVSRAAASLLESDPWREAGPHALLIATGEAPLWLHSRAALVAGDLSGLRLAAPTPALRDWIALLGASPPEASAAQLDGVILSWGGLAGNAPSGLTRHVQLGAPPQRAAALTPALATRLWVLAMRRDRLAGLAVPERAVLTASLGAEVAATAGRGFDQVDRLAREDAMAPGVTIYRPDPAHLPGWRYAAAVTETQLLDRLSAQGHDAQALRRAAMLALARASAVRGERPEARTRPPRGMGG